MSTKNDTPGYSPKKGGYVPPGQPAAPRPADGIRSVLSPVAGACFALDLQHRHTRERDLRDAGSLLGCAAHGCTPLIRCEARGYLRTANKSVAAHLRYAIGEPFPSTGRTRFSRAISDTVPALPRNNRRISGSLRLEVHRAVRLVSRGGLSGGLQSIQDGLQSQAVGNVPWHSATGAACSASISFKRW